MLINTSFITHWAWGLTNASAKGGWKIWNKRWPTKFLVFTRRGLRHTVQWLREKLKIVSYQAVAGIFTAEYVKIFIWGGKEGFWKFAKCSGIKQDHYLILNKKNMWQSIFFPSSLNFVLWYIFPPKDCICLILNIWG